jgi:hypothetical protein
MSTKIRKSKSKKNAHSLRANQLPLGPSNRVLQEFDNQQRPLGASMYGPDLLKKAYNNNIQKAQVRIRESVEQMTGEDAKRKAKQYYAKLTRKKRFNPLHMINEVNESNHNNNSDFSDFDDPVVNDGVTQHMTQTSNGQSAQKNLHHTAAAAAATKPRKLPWQFVQEFNNAQAASAAAPKNRSRKNRSRKNNSNSNNEFVMVKTPTIILNSIKQKYPSTFDSTIDQIKFLLDSDEYTGDRLRALRLIKAIYNARSKNNNEEQLKKELINTFVSDIATNQNLTRKIQTINKLK